MQDQPKRTAGYCRVSTARQADEGTSLETQEQQMRDDAERRGETWTRTYADPGLSGRSTAKRTELNRMLDDADAGEFDVLVFTTIDRVGRNVKDLAATFERLEQAGIVVRSLKENIDTSTAAGKLQMQMLFALAEFQSNRISEGVTDGMRTNALKGRRSGGPRPYGFLQRDGTLIPVPEEVAVAERIFREYVAGKPQNQIARDLNRDGYTTAQGSRWHQAQISQQLRDPKWAGHTRRKIDGDWIVYENTHEAVIAAGLFDQAAQMLTSSGRRGRQTRTFLLGNGLLRCGRCGSAMRVMPKDKSWRKQDYYGCLGRYDGRAECDQPTVPRDRIDQAVLHYFQSVGLDVDAMVQEHAESRERRRGDVRARIGNAQKTATRAEAQLDHLDALLRKGGEDGLTPAEWRRLSHPTQTELNAANAALGDLRTEEQAILSEADLADAEQETLEALASLRAVVAGEIAGAGEIEAAQAALRRIFSHFVLHDLRDIGKALRTVRIPKRALTDAEGWIVEPVPHPQMIVTEHITVGDVPFPVERLRKVPLQISGSGGKEPAR